MCDFSAFKLEGPEFSVRVMKWIKNLSVNEMLLKLNVEILMGNQFADRFSDMESHNVLVYWAFLLQWFTERAYNNALWSETTP